LPPPAIATVLMTRSTAFEIFGNIGIISIFRHSNFRNRPVTAVINTTYYPVCPRFIQACRMAADSTLEAAIIYFT
jgi:hypothetical protein